MVVDVTGTVVPGLVSPLGTVVVIDVVDVLVGVVTMTAVPVGVDVTCVIVPPPPVPCVVAILGVVGTTELVDEVVPALVPARDGLVATS